MKKKLKMLSLGLNSDQYHAGLMEIRHQFEGDRSDDYLNGLVNDVTEADGKLLDAMHIDKVRRNVKQENRQLMERLMSTSRYLDSSCYVSDEVMKACALALKQLFDTYRKPFAWMKVDERVGAVSALLRDLSAPGMQKQIDKLPEMSGRVKDMQEAFEALEVALHEVATANGTLTQGQSLMALKRAAADKLEKLVDYLKAMSAKVPETYGEHYAVVTEIIERLNATRRRSDYLHIEVELEEDEDTTEKPKLTAVSA